MMVFTSYKRELHDANEHIIIESSFLLCTVHNWFVHIFQSISVFPCNAVMFDSLDVLIYSMAKDVRYGENDIDRMIPFMPINMNAF